MDFSEALNKLKAGEQVSRKAWNGTGKFLWIKPEFLITSDKCFDPNLKKIAEHYGNVKGNAIISSCWINENYVPCVEHWNPSNSDILANDWFVC